MNWENVRGYDRNSFRPLPPGAERRDADVTAGSKRRRRYMPDTLLPGSHRLVPSQRCRMVAQRAPEWRPVGKLLLRNLQSTSSSSFGLQQLGKISNLSRGRFKVPSPLLRVSQQMVKTEPAVVVPEVRSGCPAPHGQEPPHTVSADTCKHRGCPGSPQSPPN